MERMAHAALHAAIWRELDGAPLRANLAPVPAAPRDTTVARHTESRSRRIDALPVPPRLWAADAACLAHAARCSTGADGAAVATQLRLTV